MRTPSDWLVPDWPAPARVHALFTTRAGGVSVSPFDSFNLGDHVRDDLLAVAANRQRLREGMGARPVFLSQVHGTRVAALDEGTPDGTEADGCLSTLRGVACTIMVADCLPVLFTNTAGTAVAAAHAGWRGLAGEGAGSGVIDTTFNAFVQAVQRIQPAMARERVAADTLVWLGPCIGPQAFEVGPEVREVFVDQHEAARACFQPAGRTGKYLADLPALARWRLQDLGINRVFGNDGAPPWCTVSQASRFFSHRRDAARFGSTGRMAACIWLG